MSRGSRAVATVPASPVTVPTTTTSEARASSGRVVPATSTSSASVAFPHAVAITTKINKRIRLIISSFPASPGVHRVEAVDVVLAGQIDRVVRVHYGLRVVTMAETEA